MKRRLLSERQPSRDPSTAGDAKLERVVAGKIFATYSYDILDQARQLSAAAAEDSANRVRPSNSDARRGAEYIGFVQWRKRRLQRKLERDAAMGELEEVLQRDSRLRTLYDVYGEALELAMREVLTQQQADTADGLTGESMPVRNQNEVSDELSE